MTLLEEIREHFATGFIGARELSTLPKIYPAETIRLQGEYGAAIPFECDLQISETFANVKIQSRLMNIGGKYKRKLYLSCESEALKYEFAALCAEFVEPGINGKNRRNIIDNPIEWWKKWRSLLGNVISEKNVYSVIGEMLVLEHLLKIGKEVVWKGPDAGSHDIESTTHAYEVKSTVKKYESSITISSQYQLKSEKPLSLYFCRMEESEQGESINSMVDRLVLCGLKLNKLEEQLKGLGLEAGRNIRTKKYRLLEGRIFDIDETFPKITEESFVDHKLPDHLKHMEYTIDLEGLKYENWK